MYDLYVLQKNKNKKTKRKLKESTRNAKIKEKPKFLLPKNNS